jgi:hypothetical protein
LRGKRCDIGEKLIAGDEKLKDDNFKNQVV